MVHVVLCTYNGEKFIKEQIESILLQDYPDIHIYVFDDCSDDNTINIVAEMARQYNDKVSYQVNSRSHGAAMNFLVNGAQITYLMNDDDYLMFADQDDIWFSNKISRTIERMREIEINNGLIVPSLVCSDTMIVQEDLSVINNSFFDYLGYDIKKTDLAHQLMESRTQGCTIAMNNRMSNTLVKICKLNEENIFMHDGLLGILAMSIGAYSLIDVPTMMYRKHNRNVSGLMSKKQDLIAKIGHLKEQRRYVYQTIPQTKELITLFKDDIKEEQLDILKAFVSLPTKNWFTRRKLIIKYGMWKTSVMKNIGLLVLL